MQTTGARVFDPEQLRGWRDRGLRRSVVPLSGAVSAAPSTSGDRVGARLVMRSRGRILALVPGEIEWVESADNYAHVYARGTRYLVRETLGRLAGRLDGHGFVRVHRRAVVNLAHVVELRRRSRSGQELALQSGRVVAVGRRYRGHLRRLLVCSPGAAAVGDDRRTLQAADLRDELLAIERRLWTENADSYAGQLTEGAVLVFAETGAVRRAIALQEVGQEDPKGRWAEVTFREVLSTPITEDITLLSYLVVGRRERKTKAGVVFGSSIYVRDDAAWRLAFHHQIPVRRGGLTA